MSSKTLNCSNNNKQINMPTYSPKPNTTTYDPAPAGTHVARVFKFMNLGTRF